MQKYDYAHQFILQKSQELKKKINRKEFCNLHGIPESKLSRFPSDKLIEELMMFDYLCQFAGESTNVYKVE